MQGQQTNKAPMQDQDLKGCSVEEHLVFLNSTGSQDLFRYAIESLSTDLLRKMRACLRVAKSLDQVVHRQVVSQFLKGLWPVLCKCVVHVKSNRLDAQQSIRWPFKAMIGPRVNKSSMGVWIAQQAPR